MIEVMHQTFSIIGRGKAGRSLAAAWKTRVSLHAREGRPEGWVLLAVPDDAILDMAQHFEGRCAHMSGSLNFPEIPCVHPLTSFDGESADWTGAPLAVTGEAPAEIVQAFEDLGFCPFKLEADKKALYHAAAVISSGHVATLWLEAARLLKEADIDLPGRGLWPLAEVTLKNVRDKGLKGRTGPFVRKDLSTITSDIDALPAEWKNLFREIGGFYTSSS
jgi:hypothetical protein